jgi:hypothetical protein
MAFYSGWSKYIKTNPGGRTSKQQLAAQTLENHRAAHFDDVASLLAPIYLERQHTHLSALNRELLEAISTYLGINTKFSNSWDYKASEGKTGILVDLCVQSGATEYVSGPAGKSYIDANLFTERGIALTWFEYPTYPEYPQLWGAFEHRVSILDMLFNCGQDAQGYFGTADQK